MADADEERHAEQPFELGDAVADRALRDRQRIGGLRETAVARHRLESLETVERRQADERQG